MQTGESGLGIDMWSGSISDSDPPYSTNAFSLAISNVSLCASLKYLDTHPWFDRMATDQADQHLVVHVI